jgi:8-oxo-dGTP pyrophosphatase MutT (NUDIX family)
MVNLSADRDHATALKETGFWGRRGAGCLFKARDTGRILINFRSKYVQEPETWGTWGGAIDDGESPKEAVLREVEEESGFRGHVDLIPMTVFEHRSGFKYFNFLAVVNREFTPEIDFETAAYAWFAYGKWPSPKHPGLKELLSHKSNLRILAANY